MTNHEKRRKLGRCAHCKSKATKGCRCLRCHIKYKDNWKRLSAKWKNKGLCQKCGRPKRRKSLTVCEQCRLAVRLAGCRYKGMPEVEIEKAKQALVNFNGICDGCGNANQKCKGTKDWGVDHDHKTMKFRGILETGCNASMGQAGDNPKVLRKLAAYLERNK